MLPLEVLQYLRPGYSELVRIWPQSPLQDRIASLATAGSIPGCLREAMQYVDGQPAALKAGVFGAVIRIVRCARIDRPPNACAALHLYDPDPISSSGATLQDIKGLVMYLDTHCEPAIVARSANGVSDVRALRQCQSFLQPSRCTKRSQKYRDLYHLSYELFRNMTLKE